MRNGSSYSRSLASRAAIRGSLQSLATSSVVMSLKPTTGMSKSLATRCRGGGRYHHLTGVTDKGLGVRTLKSLYRRAWGKVGAVGLGDGLNDLSLLQEADIPIVVQNPASDAAARLLRKVPTARLTSAPGPQGWNETILEVVKHPVLAK